MLKELDEVNANNGNGNAKAGMGSGRKKNSGYGLGSGINRNKNSGYGLGTSLDSKVITEGLEEMFDMEDKNMGAEFGEGYAPKNVSHHNKPTPPRTNKVYNGRGGSDSTSSQTVIHNDKNSDAQLQTLKEISGILSAIDEKTAMNNRFMAAFLKAVQSGDISTDSSAFNNILSVLSESSKATRRDNGIDTKTNSLINTMTDIVRQ